MDSLVYFCLLKPGNFEVFNYHQLVFFLFWNTIFVLKYKKDG